jgi:arylformamidase
MPERPWIDVSLPLGPGTPVYPGDPAIAIEAVMTIPADPCRVSRLQLGSHSGTHVDAPAHFLADGQPLGEIPLDRWSGDAWVIALATRDHFTADDLAAAWPTTAEPVERVLLRSPNSDRWGTSEAGRVWQALTPAAAAWLVARGVRLVGIDALSIEHDDTGGFPVHHTLLGAGCLIVEGLDLRGVAPGPYELLCLPLRAEAPDGAPARAALRPR